MRKVGTDHYVACHFPLTENGREGEAPAGTS